MEVPFIGVNPNVTTDYKIGYQLETLYRNDQPRPINLNSSTVYMTLGENAFPMDNMILALHMTLDTPDVDFTLQKGATPEGSHILLRAKADRHGHIHVTPENNTIKVIERYHNGNELTLLIHMVPPAYYNASARTYYLAGHIKGELLHEALMVSGYFHNYVNSLLTPKPDLKPLQCCADDNIAGGITMPTTGRRPSGPSGPGGEYEWPDEEPELIWTHWGQTNITFDYMQEEQPYLLFEDLD